MVSLSAFLKGLLLQNEVDRSKELIIQVSPSATTGTSTTLIAAQTADQVITLPDGSGSLSTANSVETLTNKTINAPDNTITNIANVNIASGAAIAVNKLAAQTANRALQTDGSGFMAPSVVTSTELGYVSGVTSSIQTQLNSAAVNPMTTLGDTLYENVTPAPTRLPGNITATKNFLTQTGTGSVSAAPAWGTIQVADVPTLNQSTTGTASNVTGIVAIANGGTGQSTANTALNALLPTQASNAGLYLKSDGINTSWKSSLGTDKVVGALGSNTATVNSMSANFVVLKNTSNEIVIRNNPGTVTNDKSAGVGAGARDQSSVFPANSWVHYYWIWNGTTLSTISSLSDPTVGPTLPLGYTHWAYHGSLFVNGVSDLLLCTQRGSWVYQNGPGAIGTGLAATTPTDLSLTNVIPPNALSYQVRYEGQINSTAGGLASATLAIYSSGSTIFNPFDFTYTGLGASNPQLILSGAIVLPNFNGNLRYAWIIVNGTAQQASFFHNGYQIPNGDS